MPTQTNDPNVLFLDPSESGGYQSGLYLYKDSGAYFSPDMGQYIMPDGTLLDTAGNVVGSSLNLQPIYQNQSGITLQSAQVQPGTGIYVPPPSSSGGPAPTIQPTQNVGQSGRPMVNVMGGQPLPIGQGRPGIVRPRTRPQPRRANVSLGSSKINADDGLRVFNTLIPSEQLRMLCMLKAYTPDPSEVERYYYNLNNMGLTCFNKPVSYYTNPVSAII